MYCKSCGKQIADDATFCPGCGAPQGSQTGTNYAASQPDTADKTIVVLSVLLPIVGIILGILNINKGLKESGTAYLKAAIISMVVCGVIYGIGTGMLMGAMY